MNIIRCMGKKSYKKQCRLCERLPRNKMEEDAVRWFDVEEGYEKCPKFMHKKTKYRSDMINVNQ